MECVSDNCQLLGETRIENPAIVGLKKRNVNPNDNKVFNLFFLAAGHTDTNDDRMAGVEEPLEVMVFVAADGSAQQIARETALKCNRIITHEACLVSIADERSMSKSIHSEVEHFLNFFLVVDFAAVKRQFDVRLPCLGQQLFEIVEPLARWVSTQIDTANDVRMQTLIFQQQINVLGR